LVAKNPKIQGKLKEKGKFSEKELLSFYKEVIEEISEITQGPISIEVYADKNTKAEEMLKQARGMVEWTAQACIKLPINKEGLKAAQQAVKEGIPVNMTLCFSQEQAAAVHDSTRGAKKNVFVSPFIGRLDDLGLNGMCLVKNILKMYHAGDGHIQTLAASVRNLDHLFYALKIACPLITVPFKVLEEWQKKDFFVPDGNFTYQPDNLKPIPYREISLGKNWQEYDIYHELTDKGIERFCNDWNSLFLS
jgi:transaldolase